MGSSFQLAAKVLLYASSHRQDNTYHGLCYTRYFILFVLVLDIVLSDTCIINGVKFSSVVVSSHGVMDLQIPHGGPIEFELVFVPAGAPQLVYCNPVCGMVHIKNL